MDGDLQNDPADIPALLAKLDEGYDVVLGQRANRQDSFVIRKLPSLMANWLIRKVMNIPFKDFGCTLRALRRDVAESLPLYGEMHRFVPALALQHGAADGPDPGPASSAAGRHNQIQSDPHRAACFST